MALLGFESFDHLASASPHLDLQLKPYNAGLGGASGTGVWTYTGSNGFTKGAGLLGGFAAVSGGTGFKMRCDLPSTYATLIQGFRFFTGTSVTTLTDIFAFMDSTTIQCGLSINTAGKLIFWRGTNATILATGTTALLANNWYFIEILATIHNSAGVVQVRLNAVDEIPNTGSLNTRNSANNQATGFQIASSGVQGSFDDMTTCDTSGSAPYNTFLGIIRVETLYPTANNSVTWTPHTSTNVSQVQEVANDGDTSYNTIAVTGQDTFTHGALSSTPNTIFAVAVTASVRKDDVGAQQTQTTLISNGTTQQGTAQNTPTAYAYIRDVYANDPHTSSAWAGAAVNATDIGYNHV